MSASSSPESVGSAPADPLGAVLGGLGRPPSGDTLRDALALNGWLDLFELSTQEASARVRVLDVFHDRALACASSLKPELAASALPVSDDHRSAADALASVLMRIAAAYLQALRARTTHKPARTAGNAMLCLLDAHALCSLVAAPSPCGLWNVAHALLMHARTMAAPATLIAGCADAEQLYRELIAMELAQPSHLAPADFFNIAEYVRSYSGAVQLQLAPPHRDLDSWFWIDDELDCGPVPLLRDAPDPARAAHILYCSCQRLGQVLGHHLDLIDEGGHATDLHLPACLGQIRIRRLMRQLQTRWMAMPRRQHARRERDAAIRMLTGFDAIWNLLDRRDPGGAPWENETTGWTLLNDSANGFALRLETGPTRLVRPGMPVLVKGSGSRNWMICVVRWARSAAAGAVDIGVELLSHGAQAAKVVFATSPSRGGVPALRLPPLTSRRPHPGILMQPGLAAVGRDVVVAHLSGSRYRLIEARISDLDMQTPTFELYELDESGALPERLSSASQHGR